MLEHPKEDGGATIAPLQEWGYNNANVRKNPKSFLIKFRRAQVIVKIFGFD
jgi:hypothetical protein